MKAKYYVNLACCVTAVSLLGTHRASAGPYPLDQLKVWLKDTQIKLAAVQREIAELESRIPAAGAIVPKLLNAVRLTALIADATNQSRLTETRREVAVLQHDLAKLRIERQALMSEIESIRVQISAWDEIGRGGGE